MRNRVLHLCLLLAAILLVQPSLVCGQAASVSLKRIEDGDDAGVAAQAFAGARDNSECPRDVTCVPDSICNFGESQANTTFDCIAAVGGARGEIDGLNEAEIFFPRPGELDFTINANSIFGFGASVIGVCPAPPFNEMGQDLFTGDCPDRPPCTSAATGVNVESLTEFFVEVERTLGSTDEDPDCSDDGMYTMSGHFTINIVAPRLEAFSAPDGDTPFILAKASCGDSFVEVQWDRASESFILVYYAEDENEETICKYVEPDVVVDPDFLDNSLETRDGSPGPFIGSVKISFEQLVEPGEEIFASTGVGLGQCLMLDGFEHVSETTMCLQEYVNYRLATEPSKSDLPSASITVFAEVRNRVVEGDINGDGEVNLADTDADDVAGFFDGDFPPELDIDNDCDVDGADYIAFKDHLVECGLIVIGDINGDGVANLLDVGSFVDKLTNGEFCIAGVINCDGVLDLLDVGPFVDHLSN